MARKVLPPNNEVELTPGRMGALRGSPLSGAIQQRRFPNYEAS